MISKKIALATLFGVMIFASKLPLITPLDKAVVIIQALLLALGYLLLGRLGATYVALVGGLLATIIRPVFVPFSLIFAVLFGLLVDGFCVAFRVKTSPLSTVRLSLSVGVATALIGLISYYTTVYVFTLLERNLVLETVILVLGTLSGVVGGYLAALIWKRYLSALVTRV